MTPHHKELLQQGIARFNRGQFLECHEVLEEAWLEASGEQKIFLQGLIQIAVAFHHLRQGNLAGAHRLLTAGMDKLAAFASGQESVDVGGLLAALEPLRQQFRSGEVPGDWPAPQISCKMIPTPPTP